MAGNRRGPATTVASGRRAAVLVAAGLAAVLVLAACDTGANDPAKAAQGSPTTAAPSTTPPTTAAPTTTEAPPTTEAPATTEAPTTTKPKPAAPETWRYELACLGADAGSPPARLE